jgi:transcriptional regulator with XRE-family HTH domain
VQLTLGVIVKRMRRDAFLSQRELAELAGVSRITIARIETNATFPSLRTIRKLANALGTHPKVLVEGTYS